MLGLGIQELLIIGVIIFLIFFLPSYLPKMGKNLGHGIREFKNIKKEFADAKDDVTKTAQSVSREIQS